MGDLHRLPRPPMSAAQVEEIRAAMSAPDLTPSELLHGPVEAINQPGMWVAAPGTPAEEDLVRVVAIASAMLGPGRVRFDDGIKALRALVNAADKRGGRP